MRHVVACSRCLRWSTSDAGTFRGRAQRFFSTSIIAKEELQTEAPTAATPPPPSATVQPNPMPANASPKDTPEYMQKWGELDPNAVEGKRDERRLMRREGIQPVGSRRRRAALRRSGTGQLAQVEFEQLPYQCFQEARKLLQQDRQEKIKEIQTQSLRIHNLSAQDPAISGGEHAKEIRLQSMRTYRDELVILADINDPMVKRKFEDGQGDMNKPIYRYLADQKWRKYKRRVLEQRIAQLNIVPDLLPALDPIVDVDLAFGRKLVGPGEFVDSAISEQMPRLTVQSFVPGDKLVTIVVVDADVPQPTKDTFTYRCHFIASNITISPTQASIAFTHIAQQDAKAQDSAAKKIALPWSPPYAHKGAPYHRLAIFVFEQQNKKAMDVAALSKLERKPFILRRFIDQHGLKAIGATLFRTKWDESMSGVMERSGRANQVGVEFKRKRVEPLPYKKRTERMR